MSRAVFISAGGDCFILLTVLKLWKEHWYDEVDRVYIDYNSSMKRDVVNELFVLLDDPKIHFIYHPTGVGNGTPITEMAQIAKEDYVMLLEDDGFIFTPGKVDECFKRIESGEVDALGSLRFSCGPEIGEALKKKYDLDYTGYGDVGPNVWPNFFFCKRADLLKTDLNFASYEFKEGVYYPELDHTMLTTEYADTFGWACMQMRHQGVRFGDIPQFHADPWEIENKEKNEGNWIKENPYWLHGGSLSSGWSGYLSLDTPHPHDTTDDTVKREMESRVAFWMICANAIDGFNNFKYDYQKGIDNLIRDCNLDRDRIGQKVGIYKTLMQL